MIPKTPHCPYVVATVPGAESYAETLTQIPGVRVRGERVIIPHHALSVMDRRLSENALTPHAPHWVNSPPPPATWEEIEALLRRNGEVREWVLDGFLVGYQMEALVFGFTRVGLHFWHSTGAGKTLSAILYGLLQDGPLVVVTRAASRLQYGREIERFTHLRPYVIRPAGAMKAGAETLEEYLSEPSGRRKVVLVGWESVGDHIDTLTALRPGCTIFDESHRGKGSKRNEAVPLVETDDLNELVEQQRAARARGGFVTTNEIGNRMMIVPVENMASAAAKLARASKRRVCTTATAIRDRVRDLWSQLDLAEPEAWGNATTWLNRYADRKPGVYGGFDTTGASNLDELVSRLSYVVHKVDYRVTHRSLPPKRRQSVYVAPEDQVKPVAGFQKELNEAAKRGPSALMEVKLAQAASSKRKAVVGLVEDHLNNDQKVIIFTGRRKDCDELGNSFKSTKAKTWVTHGGDSTQLRQEIVDEYMSHPGPCLLVSTGDSLGESINLQDTDALLFVMLPWTPGQVRQWEGRVSRLGQKRPVTIYYVVAEGTVDEHVADALVSKLPAVERIGGDKELAEAKKAITGTDEEAALMDSILNKVFASSADEEDDE
jgi:hypothetical protein